MPGPLDQQPEAWSARFGILRDDYTPKAAFTTLQHLIAMASMR